LWQLAIALGGLKVLIMQQNNKTINQSFIYMDKVPLFKYLNDFEDQTGPAAN